MTEKLGASGNFPQGKLDETDEGELTLGVHTDLLKKVVRIDFGGKKVAWLALERKEALELANVIRKHAEFLSEEPK